MCMYIDCVIPLKVNWRFYLGEINSSRLIQALKPLTNWTKQVIDIVAVCCKQLCVMGLFILYLVEWRKQSLYWLIRRHLMKHHLPTGAFLASAKSILDFHSNTGWFTVLSICVQSTYKTSIIQYLLSKLGKEESILFIITAGFAWESSKTFLNRSSRSRSVLLYWYLLTQC